MSQPVYSRYENNEKKVKKDDAFVKRVSEEFKVSQKWLTSEEDNNISIVFEKDSINTGSTGVIGQIENYYVVPKDFLDSFTKQQQLLERVLEKFLN